MDGRLKNNYCSLMENDAIVYNHTMFHLESSAYRSNIFNTLIKLLKCMHFLKYVFIYMWMFMTLNQVNISMLQSVYYNYICRNFIINVNGSSKLIFCTTFQNILHTCNILHRYSYW